MPSLRSFPSLTDHAYRFCAKPASSLRHLDSPNLLACRLEGLNRATMVPLQLSKALAHRTMLPCCNYCSFVFSSLALALPRTLALPCPPKQTSKRRPHPCFVIHQHTYSTYRIHPPHDCGVQYTPMCRSLWRSNPASRGVRGQGIGMHAYSLATYRPRSAERHLPVSLPFALPPPYFAQRRNERREDCCTIAITRG
jgi:hypothetical protein